MKKIFVALFIFSLLAAPLFYAQAVNPCTKEAIKPNDAGSALPQCINQIYIWSLGIGALLALLMTIIGGYTYMTAAGNATSQHRGFVHLGRCHWPCPAIYRLLTPQHHQP